MQGKFELLNWNWNDLFCNSDDRSIEIFRTRLETATQMREVLTKDCKPNCLLIDEIDGAPAVRDCSSLRDYLCVS